MKFKEFKDWCEQRTCDGCWGPYTALTCINVLREVNKNPFWKREKIWHNTFEKDIIQDIVNPINQKMKERGLLNE